MVTNVVLKPGDKGHIYDTWEVEKRQVSQAAAGYDAFGAKGGKGCANCQWYIPRSDACVLVSGDISPTGSSNFYTPVVVEETPPLLVKLVDSKSLTGQSKEFKKEETNGESKGFGILDKIVSGWRGLWELDGAADETAPKPFMVFRTKEGDLRFFVVYSNIFEDKTKEIFSTKAHQEYVDWIDKQRAELYPELQIWHGGPGSVIGKCDVVDLVDGFAVAGGVVYKEHESKAQMMANEDTGVSHGYLGIQGIEGDKIYSLYRPWEISVLPAAKAANAWTEYQVGIKEQQMGYAPEKRAYFKTLGYTDDHIVGMERSLEGFTQRLKDAGINFKAEGTEAAAPVTETVPAPVPPVASAPAPEPIPTVVAPPAATTPVVAGKELSAEQAFLKSLVDGIQARDEVIGQLVSSVKGLSDQVEQLAKPINDQIADAMTARIETNPSNAGYIASASQKNLEAGGKAAKIGDDSNPDFNWFHEHVLQPLNPAVMAGISNNGQAPVPTGTGVS